MTTAEHVRLEEDRERKASWKKWGPYLSERQWGTVREDSSDDGNAWDYFTHDQSRSRAYRWGEDGLAGVSDDKQFVCVALALWNGRDPIIKERLFGLTNSEGNHGEDVKEYYFYLDSTPTHSYMKYLYKYPQAAYPYADLVETNRARGRDGDGVRAPRHRRVQRQSLFRRVRRVCEGVTPRPSHRDYGPQPRARAGHASCAADHLVPEHLVVGRRWPPSRAVSGRRRPRTRSPSRIHRSDSCSSTLKARRICCSPKTKRTTSASSTVRTGRPYVKDGINDFIVHGRREAVNPNKTGTKAAAHYPLTVAAGASQVVRLRLSDVAPPAKGSTKKAAAGPFSKDFDAVMNARRREADEFYATVIPPSLDEDHARVMRQALAGMMWTKQFFHYDVDTWLSERGSDPFKAKRRGLRNQSWHHMHNADVISMPDKWEYPWYAAWDLAFHVLALTLVDEDFGKQQLDLMLREDYLHPNGQIPAYEWNFGDVNPPVHAWATIFTHRLMKTQAGRGRRGVAGAIVSQAAAQLHLVGEPQRPLGSQRLRRRVPGTRQHRRVRPQLTVAHRRIPGTGRRHGVDGALLPEHARDRRRSWRWRNPAYAEMCDKFIAHFLWIALAMTQGGEDGAGMWDEEDGFFYDVLRLPDGSSTRLKVRSMVGLLPLCAATVFDGTLIARSTPKSRTA